MTLGSRHRSKRSLRNCPPGVSSVESLCRATRRQDKAHYVRRGHIGNEEHGHEGDIVPPGHLSHGPATWLERTHTLWVAGLRFLVEYGFVEIFGGLREYFEKNVTAFLCRNDDDTKCGLIVLHALSSRAPTGLVESAGSSRQEHRRQETCQAMGTVRCRGCRAECSTLIQPSSLVSVEG